MKIRFGYEIAYVVPQSTPMIVMLSAQPNATQRLIIPDRMETEPQVRLKRYRDAHGNRCIRLVAPAGSFKMTADALLDDSGIPEPAILSARQMPISELPREVMLYLLPSRYCESDLLAHDAHRLFGHLNPGWSRVQAI